MKKIYLFAIICIGILSCSKDEATSENIGKTNEVLVFTSIEKMDQKIDEISAIKAEMDSNTAQKYISKNVALQTSLSDSAILTDLKNYHSDRLIDIDNLRKQLNFVSIQSIADEINSLQLLDSDKANKLFLQYEKFLSRNKYDQVETIFTNRTSEVINEKGDVIINGKSTDFKINHSQNSTGKFISESGKQGIAAYSPDMKYIILFSAGRQTHEDDFGKTFFRYYTEFQALFKDPATGLLTPCPSLFSTQSSSYAGFSQSGNNPLADFSFTMSYPGGSGSSIRNVGGQKWTAYQTEGGYIKGAYAPLGDNIAGILICDFQYDSAFVKK
jgi:hypothetical protein